jgi:hypothetical protein
MRASAFDKPTARLMGINVNAVIAATFALTGALGGTASILHATAYPQIFTFMGVQPGLKSFVAAVIGGIGSIPGAFVGSLIMGFIEAMTVGYMPLGSTLKDGIAFLLRPPKHIPPHKPVLPLPEKALAGNLTGSRFTASASTRPISLAKYSASRRPIPKMPLVCTLDNAPSIRGVSWDRSWWATVILIRKLHTWPVWMKMSGPLSRKTGRPVCSENR